MSPKIELVCCAASTSPSAVPCCLIMLLLALLMQGFEMIEIIVDVENCLQVHYLLVLLQNPLLLPCISEWAFMFLY
jgi:hypothetical protein